MVVAIQPIVRSSPNSILEPEPDDQRITLDNITWEQYEMLLT